MSRDKIPPLSEWPRSWFTEQLEAVEREVQQWPAWAWKSAGLGEKPQESEGGRDE